MLRTSLLATVVLLASGFITAHPLSAATPPALSNPSASPESPLGPEFIGALNGAASVSAGGNASYVIPIELPPGVGGIAPGISLNYNSNVRNGLLGLGWFMDGASSRITRCPQNMAQDGQVRAVDYSSDDTFCLDGHRLVVVNSGTYGADGTVYRTETDNFSRVESIGFAGTGPAQFEVRSKGGLIKHYGTVASSRIEAQGRSEVRVWALDKVEDQSGNYYSIAYTEDNANGAYYPDTITYTSNDVQGISPSASVEFSYESRTDDVLTYEAGLKVRLHPMRLSSIETYSNTALVTQYSLSYEEIGVDSRSRITDITQCDALSTCKEPITFEWWHDGSVSFTEESLTVPYFPAKVALTIQPRPWWVRGRVFPAGTI